MEFERSIYRVHERMLAGQNVKPCLRGFKLTMLIFLAVSIYNLFLFHGLFVGKRDFLKNEIEKQLKPYFYSEYEKLRTYNLNKKMFKRIYGKDR